MSSSDELIIDIDRGSTVIYLPLNSYIVEVYFPEAKPFEVYGQEYFESAYIEASYEEIEEELEKWVRNNANKKEKENEK